METIGEDRICKKIKKEKLEIEKIKETLEGSKGDVNRNRRIR